MTAQLQDPTPAPAARPDNPFAYAVTMANLITETAVVIGATTVRPAALTVMQSLAGPCPWVVEVQVDTPTQVDEVGRALAIPVVGWSENLHTRAWDGVSLAGDLVTVRVYSGRTA